MLAFPHVSDSTQANSLGRGLQMIKNRKQLVQAMGTAAIALSAAGMALMPGTAQADFPGALWSVEHVAVTVAPGAAIADSAALKGRIAASLRRANDTYFYGERPAKMTVRILSDNAMTIALVDRKTGAVVTEMRDLSPQTDISAGALAWMDGLTCASLDCATATQAPTALAAAPVRTAPQDTATGRLGEILPDARAATVREVIETATELAHHDRREGVPPIPAARPQQTAQMPQTLGRIQVARTQPRALDTYADPIRIARFNTEQLGRLSYTPADKLVLATPPSTTLSDAQPPALRRESSTAVGRLFESVARLFGFVEPTPEAAFAPRPAGAASSIAAAPRSALAVKPTATWRLQPSTRTALELPEPRLAALAPSSAATATRPGFRGIRVVPSPGLLPPRSSRQTSASNAGIVTPIRVAAAPAPAVNRNLSVKLDRKLLNSYAPGAFGQLFSSYQNEKAKVLLVAGRDDAGERNRTVDSILASRGLVLDADRFAKAERVFWGGKTGSRNFWISLPQVAPARFVLVASDTASVIAKVHAGSGNGVRVSDAVAKALGMQSGMWSDIQIVALRETERTARRRDRVRIVR